MHPRDLYLLADILEARGEVEQFQWVSGLELAERPTQAVSECRCFVELPQLRVERFKYLRFSHHRLPHRVTIPR